MPQIPSIKPSGLTDHIQKQNPAIFYVLETHLKQIFKRDYLPTQAR